MYRGRRAVISVPAETLLAAILVPSWASAKAKAIKKTPARLLDVPSFRNDCRRVRGFQIGSPWKITVLDEETMIPMKEVTAKPRGIVSNCDQRASLGFRAKRAKSGSFTMSVAKLEILYIS